MTTCSKRKPHQNFELQNVPPLTACVVCTKRLSNSLKTYRLVLWMPMSLLLYPSEVYPLSHTVYDLGTWRTRASNKGRKQIGVVHSTPCGVPVPWSPIGQRVLVNACWSTRSLVDQLALLTSGPEQCHGHLLLNRTVQAVADHEENQLLSTDTPIILLLKGRLPVPL